MYGNLHNYATGEYLRPATADELESSIDAMRIDCGVGAFDCNGTTCYVEDAIEVAASRAEAARINRSVAASAMKPWNDESSRDL